MPLSCPRAPIVLHIVVPFHLKKTRHSFLFTCPSKLHASVIYQKFAPRTGFPPKDKTKEVIFWVSCHVNRRKFPFFFFFLFFPFPFTISQSLHPSLGRTCPRRAVVGCLPFPRKHSHCLQLQLPHCCSRSNPLA